MSRNYGTEFFLGHHRSLRYPDGEIIVECKHAGGAFLSIFQHNRGDLYFVCTRYHRKERNLIPFMPQEMYMGISRDDARKTADAAFEDDFYEWGWEDLAKAEAFYNHVKDMDKHPCMPQITKQRRKPRDSQKHKVYDWEQRFYRGDANFYDMTDQDITDLVRLIEYDYPVARFPANLTFHEKGGCYQRGFREVNIAEYGRNRCTVIHEMAHWIVSNHFSRCVPGHGQEYVGIFMLLMERYCGSCLTDMINHAMDRNVKFIFPEGGMIHMKRKVAPKLKEAA